MSYYVHTGSDEYGGELFEYDTLDEAADAVRRLALAAFLENDKVIRSYTILYAENKEDAERQVEDCE